MSAITTNIEQAEEPVTETIKHYRGCAGRDGIEPEGGGELRGLGDFDDDVCPMPAEVLSDSHGGLLNMVWARQATIDQISGLRLQPRSAGREVRLYLLNEDGTPARIGRQDARCPEAGFCTPQGEPVWNPSGTGGHATLTTWTSKMCCPSFSLPSGHSAVGGACPGAVQTVVPQEQWIAVYRQALVILGLPDRAKQVADTVCQHCYAAHGKYGTGGVQAAQVLRYIWVQQALKNKTFIPVMDWAVKNANYKLDGNRSKKDPLPKEKRRPGVDHGPGGQKYFRIHDSGDFFSYEYLSQWIEVCKKNPDVKFWAPTRIWPRGGGIGAGGWSETQTKGIDAMKDAPDNLIVRPSAYHINEHGPGGLGKLGEGWSAASVTIAADQNLGMTTEREEMITKYLWDNFKAERTVGRSDQFDHDPRFTWECPAYLEAAGKHRCRDAVDVDGTSCCRVCWTHPDEVVNYTLHA